MARQIVMKYFVVKKMRVVEGGHDGNEHSWAMLSGSKLAPKSILCLADHPRGLGRSLVVL